MITAAGADLLVDATLRLSRFGAVAMCLALPAIVSASATWLAQTITSYADIGGWSLTRQALVTVLATRGYAWTTVATVVLVLVLVVIGRRQTPYPQPDQTPGLGAILGVATAAGAGAGATIITYRATHGPARDLAEAVQRTDAYTWVFALAGAAAVTALAVRFGRSGLAAGLAAGPIATALAECVLICQQHRIGWIADGDVQPGGVALGARLGRVAHALRGRALRGRRRPLTVARRTGPRGPAALGCAVAGGGGSGYVRATGGGCDRCPRHAQPARQCRRSRGHHDGPDRSLTAVSDVPRIVCHPTQPLDRE